MRQPARYAQGGDSPVKPQLVVNPDRCTGCRACETACSFAHYEEFNPQKSAVRVSIFTEQCFFLPVVCLQCSDAACVAVCPSGAMHADEIDGGYVVLVDRERCVGCHMCVLACPFGCVEDDGANSVRKCDLCDGDPACVHACATKALDYAGVNSLTSARRKALAERMRLEEGRQ